MNTFIDLERYKLQYTTMETLHRFKKILYSTKRKYIYAQNNSLSEVFINSISKLNLNFV